MFISKGLQLVKMIKTQYTFITDHPFCLLYGTRPIRYSSQLCFLPIVRRSMFAAEMIEHYKLSVFVLMVPNNIKSLIFLNFDRVARIALCQSYCASMFPKPSKICFCSSQKTLL